MITQVVVKRLQHMIRIIDFQSAYCQPLSREEAVMKKLSCVFIVLVVFLFAGCAGSSKYMQASSPIQQPPPGKALVYFMRPSGLGFAINFQIWDGEKFIGLSQAKSYFAYACEPGKHLFIGIAENKRGIECDLEAGKSYYVLTQVKMGGWRARMAFIPVTRDSEFWNQVEQYKDELNFIAAKKEMLLQWEAKEKGKIQEIIAFLNTPEGRQYVVEFAKTAGR